MRRSRISRSDYLTGQGTFAQHQDAYKKIERSILSDNFDAWYYRLSSDKREEGCAIFEKHWGKDKVILGLLYDIENKQYDINQKGISINELDNELTCVRSRFDKKLAQKNLVIDQLGSEISTLTQRLEEKTSLYEKTEQERRDAQAQYEHVLNSLSYKIGCVVTWLPRKIAGVIRQIKIGAFEVIIKSEKFLVTICINEYNESTYNFKQLRCGV